MIKKKIKKAIVFGGSGFLGSHVADELTNNNFDVTIFDLKKSKYKHKKQKMILGDINNFNQVKKVIKDKNYIFNFGGVADIEEANDYPFKTIHSNIIGLTNILEAVKYSKKLKRVVFASSIYARSSQGGFYSASKRACESIIENYSDKYNLKYSILRFGALYGLRSNHFNTINNFILEAINKKKITRDTLGKEVRNYINAKDASKIVLELLKKKYENNYFNIYGKNKITIKKLIKMIGRLTKVKKLKFSKKTHDKNHYQKNPYTYKIKKGTTMLPDRKVSLENDLNEIITLYKKK